MGAGTDLATREEGRDDRDVFLAHGRARLVRNPCQPRRARLARNTAAPRTTCVWHRPAFVVFCVVCLACRSEPDAGDQPKYQRRWGRTRRVRRGLTVSVTRGRSP